MTQAQSHDFQAETQKLLNIIIHSIYTQKEIFLRELVSNASDALDKVRFEQSRGSDIADPDQELRIDIQVQQEQGKLTVSDTGIGMNSQEIVDNLGTIAKSGTEEFLKQVADQNQNPDNIIGQFGVGFYSVFMVADRVRVKSKSARREDPAVFWSSDGRHGYEVAELEENLPRGTSVEIDINQDCQEFLDPERIKTVIKTHSNFISFPIYVNQEKVNTVPALWKESKFNINQEQYNEFFRFLSYDTQDPLLTLHISVDAPVQFTGLLFIPAKSRMMLESYASEYGLDLYVHRVLIQRKNQEVIPQYLGFLEGVVDTEDLPLNLSRQSIQENAVIRKISQTLAKQVLNRLKKLAQEEPQKYQDFWKEHGKLFKLGYTDFENQESFKELLRFNSSHLQDAQEQTSLQEYTQRMREGQKEIYFISGPSRENMEQNPHLEMFTSRGLEVLYLFEPVDEFVLQTLGSYQDYRFVAAEHVDPANLESFPLKEQEQAQEELSGQEEQELQDLLQKMQEILGERVTEVRASKRLLNSPACLVNPEQGISSQMQKIMRTIQQDTSIPKQIMEVNPRHPLTKNLLKVYARDPQDEFLRTSTEQLFEAALLMAGYLADPHNMVQRTFSLLQDAGKWYVQASQQS
ncbi:MAG: molecular chaperone HtpG [Desulfohalobiaceae bacterium]